MKQLKLKELGSGKVHEKASKGLFRAIVMIDSCLYHIEKDTSLFQAIEYSENYRNTQNFVQIFDDEGTPLIKDGKVPFIGRGKLIVIDGTDGSGKATQTKLLVSRLEQQGFYVKTFDFPHPHNHFGTLIYESLGGKHGNFAEMSPYIASVLYAADRFESSSKIKYWLENGATVVLDRYVSANQIHQGGKIKDNEEREKFLQWLDHMEHEIFQIPRPDMILYLDVPVAISQKLAKEKIALEKKVHFAGIDQHEDSVEHLTNAKESGLKMVASANNWKRINCYNGDEMLPIEEIHEIVWQQILQL